MAAEIYGLKRVSYFGRNASLVSGICLNCEHGRNAFRCATSEAHTATLLFWDKLPGVELIRLWVRAFGDAFLINSACAFKLRNLHKRYSGETRDMNAQ